MKMDQINQDDKKINDAFSGLESLKSNTQEMVKITINKLF